MNNHDWHQTHFYKTSIDVARPRTFDTTGVTGVKRTQEQRSPQRSSLGHNVEATSDDRRKSRPSLDFKRPGLHPSTSSWIQASRISDVEHSDGSVPNAVYSQRTAWSGTPGLTQNPLLSLSHPKYDLPDALAQNFLSLGIRCIYPWQSSCLLGRGLLTGQKNLVYSAPTGGGKSLVADVLMLKRIIDHPEKKAILVLPYVALVQEKLKWLRRIVEGVHKRGKNNDSNMTFSQRERNHGTIRVAGFYGGSKTRHSLADIDIAVCTIEKVTYTLQGDKRLEWTAYPKDRQMPC